MKKIPYWFAEQLDNGITLFGAIFALVMVGGALGSLFALASQKHVLAAVLAFISASLLGALFWTARKTDPNIKLTPTQRTEVWSRIPKHVKLGFSIFIAGHSLGAALGFLLEYRYGFFVSWLLTGISLLLVANGFQTAKPPLKAKNGALLKFEEAPIEYLNHLQKIVKDLRISAIFSFLFATLPLIK